MQPPKANDLRWCHFLSTHVCTAAIGVSRTLRSQDMGQAREMVLDFLDGYLTWLEKKVQRDFKKSFFISTTFLPEASISKGEKHLLDATTDHGKPNKARGFEATTKIPNSAEEARAHLEAYLVLWKSLFTICETASHASNRLAQLFDWEIRNNGPVCKLSRLLSRSSSFEDNVLGLPIDFAAHGISVTEEDVSDFYQDGIKAMEARRLNLDDLQDVSDFRIKPSRCEADGSKGFLPRLFHSRTYLVLLLSLI